MMKILLHLPVLLLPLLAAQGEVLWDNWGQSSFFSAIVVKDAAARKPDTGEGADDFILTKTAEVTEVSVLMHFGTKRSVRLWQIRFYSNEQELPGEEVLATTSGGGTFGPAYNLQVDLPLKEHFKAAPGTRYWLSVQPEYELTGIPDLRWRESTALVNGGNAVYRFRDTGTWNIWPPQAKAWAAVCRKNGQTKADFIWKLLGNSADNASKQ